MDNRPDGCAPESAITRAHDAAVAAGEPGYLDPETGLFVFTAAALAANGTMATPAAVETATP